ncbi:MAG TPA: enolase C-terminal domain-like protein [Burkholderiales bacterium]|nr:enolase C-terminal domain-like protein [Burkholderiales bacterium]
MKIKRIEPIAVSIPLAKPVRMSFEEVRAANNLLVRLETEEAVGWGEAASAPTMTGETLEGMMAAVRHLAPLLEGMPADDIAAAMARASLYLYGNHAAKSAIEMALYDALGRARGRPACELLGSRRRERAPLLRLIGTGRGAAADVEEALRLRAEGCVAFKVKVGVGDPRADAERTRAVCEALGNGGVLVCADANQGFSVEQAIAYVRALADTSLAFFEQPVPAHDLAGMACVARASRVPIGADEGLHSIEDLERHHAAGVAGGSLKTIKLGGMGPVVQAARLCERLGMKVNLACKMAESGIAAAAMAHVAAAVPQIEWGVSLTSPYLASDLLKRPLDMDRGHVAVPAGPGLGIEVDEVQVRRYAREA